MTRTRRTTRPRLALLAACSAFGLTAPAAWAASPSFVGGPLPTPAATPTSDLEPGVASAGDGTLVIGATAGGRGADLWVSHDGGLSYPWSGDPFQNPPQGANPENGQDTDVTAAPVSGSSGVPNLYATSLYSVDSSLAVSHDGGKSWQINQLGGTPSQDRPWLAADGPCTVYLAYQNGDSGPPSREMVSRFDTCQTPVLTDASAVLNPAQSATDVYPLGAFLGGKIQVDNSSRSAFHHRVYIPNGGCETDLPGPSYLPSTNPFDCQFARATISIAVSGDGGQSFTVHRVADSTTHELEIWPDDLGIDASGELYLVWSDNHNVYLNTSTDGGTTWSKSHAINVPPALSAVHPTIAASAPGHVDIAWYGTARNGDSNDLNLMDTPGASGAAPWRVYVAKSTDHGQHFDQVAVSDVVHTGIVCTTATTCLTSHSRNLYDDFGIAINPVTGLASVAYTIDSATIQPGSPHLQVGYATELRPGANHPGCPRATGALHGLSLGKVKLGMTRVRARQAYVRFATRGQRYMDFFCLDPVGIRVGYPSPQLIQRLPRPERKRISGRVILALTANPHYRLRGVRPNTPLSVAARRLRLSRPFHIGLNTWYLAANGRSRGLLKVRHGIVEEIGVADRLLTTGTAAAKIFLTSFS